MGRYLSESERYNMTPDELADLIGGPGDYPFQEDDMSAPLDDDTTDNGQSPYEALGLTIPMKTPPAHIQIGYLVDREEFAGNGAGWGFLCLDCSAVPGVYVGAPVYGVNINPYKATCVHCKRVIVQGCGTELFSGD